MADGIRFQNRGIDKASFGIQSERPEQSGEFLFPPSADVMTARHTDNSDIPVSFPRQIFQTLFPRLTHVYIHQAESCQTVFISAVDNNHGQSELSQKRHLRIIRHDAACDQENPAQVLFLQELQSLFRLEFAQIFNETELRSESLFRGGGFDPRQNIILRKFHPAFLDDSDQYQIGTPP